VSSDRPSAPTDLTITLADDGGTVRIAVGERFLLSLGTDYDWGVTVADPSIVDRVRNITVVRGAQGVYVALASGTTVLSAVGDPPCRKTTPPCGAPSRGFGVTIDVR